MKDARRGSDLITNTPYPRFVVDLKKLKHNIDVVLSNCNKENISVCGAIKGFNGLPKAAKAGKFHEVIIMSDLGDLREGFWDEEELVDCAKVVEQELDNIILKGVGTNLGCYGSIKPTATKMNELISIAEHVEERIERKLELISGG